MVLKVHHSKLPKSQTGEKSLSMKDLPVLYKHRYHLSYVLDVNGMRKRPKNLF